MNSCVISFTQLPSELLSTAGGKGSALARLSQAGFPVPAGFVILPTAFSGDELKPHAWTQVRDCLTHFREGRKEVLFAIRSSALAEDAATTSFAGAFETVLNVRSDVDIRNAIRKVRQSRSNDRVVSYSQARGLQTSHEVAVVVQKMIPSEFSGVLFTADPITGSRANMKGNCVIGLGDRLVSGRINPHSFELQRTRAMYTGPAFLAKYARKLYRLAVRLEKKMGKPQDIEWAIADGKVHLLQARAITTLIGHCPETGEWNDTLTGDYLWSNVNFGEAVTEAMTPLSWSVLQFTLNEWVFLPGVPTTGNICGNPYLNITVFASLFKALGRSQADLLKFTEGTLYMLLPEGLKIPTVPLNLRTVFAGLTNLIRIQINQRRGIRQLPVYLENNLTWFHQTRTKLVAEDSGAGLLDIWRDLIAGHIKQGVWAVLGTAMNSADFTMALRRSLTKLVGPEDANVLIATVNDAAETLPSLGPVTGLAQVASGEMSREDYLHEYGHRGPHEFEISKPRPTEDPQWFDQQLSSFYSSPVDVKKLMTKKRETFKLVWARLIAHCPRKSRTIHRQLVENTRRMRLREEARSAYVRDRWMIRLFALRAGEIVGIGNDIFYLYLPEVFAVLSGDETSLAFVPARKQTHKRYLELAEFPSIIRGRFIPQQWEADPQRRNDIFDAQTAFEEISLSTQSNRVTGSPGSSGRVEGFVRVLKDSGDSGQLQTGEILVTSQTDISWTVVFPRASAVVTDIGAPLSHAAIVARELGIPAVVGCGNATIQLATGDRVRVDGGNGTVERLQPQSYSHDDGPRCEEGS